MADIISGTIYIVINIITIINIIISSSSSSSRSAELGRRYKLAREVRRIVHDWIISVRVVLLNISSLHHTYRTLITSAFRARASNKSTRATFSGLGLIMKAVVHL